jgi:hypothetical protein
LEVPFPGYPAIEEIRECCIGEERECGEMLIVDDEVTNDRCCYQASEGEEVRDVVDLLMALFWGI